MNQFPVICPKHPLPRDIDVVVSIERPQTELATDMTLICFATPNIDLPPTTGRIRVYSTFAALQEDVTSGDSVYFAGSAFFSRQIRPARMAVGRIFDDPVPAGLVSGIRTVSFAMRQITDGAFDIMVNGALVSVTGIDLTMAGNLHQTADALNAAFGSNGLVAAIQYGGLSIATTISGDGTTLDYAASPTTGTDVSALLGLTQSSGAELWQGYTPTGIADELNLIREAGKCMQATPYGWVLDAVYRETEEQKFAADWAEATVPAYLSLCTNSVNAMRTADTTNIAYYISNNGLIRSDVIYHHNPQVYPDMSYIAYALATNYNLPDSAVTMKFKQLDGIDPSPISESDLEALNSRRCNVYVAVGNTSRTIREGVQGAESWYTDSLVNLDNFREELQTEIYNVFLRNKKVPATSAGQDKLVSAAAKICNKYTRNGVFAPRDVEADVETGFITEPATSIVPVPVSHMTASDRAQRLAPPIQITAYEAGAFHKVHVNVSVFS